MEKMTIEQVLTSALEVRNQADIEADITRANEANARRGILLQAQYELCTRINPLLDTAPPRVKVLWEELICDMTSVIDAEASEYGKAV